MRLAGRPPLIVILGATASGKTGLALQFATALNGEIIGADSRQIYRGMDIGTAKPDVQQRRSVQHHLIDIADPDENPGLAEIQRLANAAIADIQRRGRVPLLVGGTGQYLSAIVEGWRIPVVPPNMALRAELEAFAAEQGRAALHRQLASVDPDRRVQDASEQPAARGAFAGGLARDRPANQRVAAASATALGHPANWPAAGAQRAASAC